MCLSLPPCTPSLVQASAPPPIWLPPASSPRSLALVSPSSFHDAQNLPGLPSALRKKPSSLVRPMRPCRAEPRRLDQPHGYPLQLRTLDPCFPLLYSITCPTPPPPGSPPGLSGWVKDTLGSSSPALTTTGPHSQGVGPPPRLGVLGGQNLGC